MARWCLVEIRWIDAPPVARTLGVMRRTLAALDFSDQVCDETRATPVTLGEDGLLAWWRHPLVDAAGLVRTLGEYHPCRARMVEVDPAAEDEDADALARLATAPWTTPADVGPTDAAGRVRGHPGGGKGYGRARAV